MSLYLARRYEEAVAVLAEAISLAPDFKATYGRAESPFMGSAILSARATKPDDLLSQQRLAVTYRKLVFPSHQALNLRAVPLKRLNTPGIIETVGAKVIIVPEYARTAERSNHVTDK